jgi:hypothetical protein
MQNFIEAGDLKVNEIKVRLDKLPSIISKYESAQDELECLDEADYSIDREEFKNQYYQAEAKFNELLHPVVDPVQSRHSSRSSSSERRNASPVAVHTLSYLSFYYQLLTAIRVVGYNTETPLRH